MEDFHPISISPDCSVCIYGRDCPNAQPLRFCARFASKTPEVRGADPSEAWRKGEDVPEM